MEERAPAPTDVLADLLDTLRQDTLLYGRFELTAPWGIQLPDDEAAYLVVVGRGGARLEPKGGDSPLILSAGDVVLLPHGGAHRLRDSEDSPLFVLADTDCPLAHENSAIHIGGDGAATTLVIGAFHFRAAHRSLSVQRLSRAIHVPAGHPSASPGLTSTVAQLIAESSSQRPGSTVVMSRLADILLVEAIRVQIATLDCPEHGLRALGDLQIGQALALIHRRPDMPWTVERLATEVALSRSAFAARFTALVGTAPADYLVRWRMTKAAEFLREGELKTSEIAARSGYRSEASFNRAFKRTEGVTPGIYRRSHVGRPLVPGSARPPEESNP